MSNDQTPKREDAILGGQTPLPQGGLVLGGMEKIEKIEKIQDQLANPLHKGQEFYLPGLPKLVAVEMATAKEKREPDYNAQTLARYFDVSPILVCRYIEPLPLGEDDLPLEMIFISGGTFQMGSSGDGCIPAHQVTVLPFLMSRYPITRAQWEAVSGLPMVEQYLDPSPSPPYALCRNHIDAQKPVKVRWHDAVEFCQRLTQHTNRCYSLPTESEWEYGCRAGTTTRFWFGDNSNMFNKNSDRKAGETIINCDFERCGKSTYESGKPYRVTPVNFFNIANPWGLCDMHGNVGEWCLDHWKYNYFGAPVDGTAWIDERFNEERIVRGARYYDPLKTTSDSRRKTEYYNDEGFRVVVPFPKLHASPDVHPQNQDAILGGHPPSPILKTLSRTAGIQTKHIRVDIGENDPLIMVHIPAGEFLMGFKEYKIARYESLGGPQHMVKMPMFWISKYPITRSQWTALALSGQVDMPLPTNPSQPVRKLQDDIPGTYNPIYVKRDYYSVDHVSWDEAIEFCKRLSQHTGQDYRLPSEAEWQYACNPLEKNPWVSQCSPNRFGICNLHSGSCIWEWCADYWHKNHIGGPTDGSAWTRGGDSDLRVIRGGNGNGLSTTIETMRFVARSHHSPDKNDKFIGFRVVLASR